MESLPDVLLQVILSRVSDAREVAACNCVSKRWNDSMAYIKILCFPHNSFDNLCSTGESSGNIVRRMVSRVQQLERLIMYSPFSSADIESWLSIVGKSLRHLELRMDNVPNNRNICDKQTKLECIGAASNLESLRLWGVLILHSPKWNVFQNLRNLELIDVQVEEYVLNSVLQSCPFVTRLLLIKCQGILSIAINLTYLEECKLDIYGMGNCSFNLNSPLIESLEVQGCSVIVVPQSNHLRHLSISNKAGRVYRVDFGNLPSLEFLSMRGICWYWDAICKMLKLASEVKHLFMKVEFTGNFDTLQPFPEIDFVDFFNNHKRLQKFDIHGAMFAALNQRNSVKNMNSGFVIPCLEEVVITVRSPLNAEQKMGTLQSLLKYGKNVKIMVIKITQMKSTHWSVDEFFKQISWFKYMNRKIVRIE
ncbi:hypothetical protein Lal_00006117 [Lupinus albus]|uniref:Putative F-box domain, leucine-rich repeat domain, L domain-containing protein n=1 Tax=Lupinus albus TaxID=3870 RepID=A0A6A4Q859_LUPAL|nr:putative F-box domain, leucine-rich repeat domain, L domain-containing protein [Lupinus albus]KAF1875489.1 hypothetical protein Lal_00006117 [Lupinus albus]